MSGSALTSLLEPLRAHRRALVPLALLLMASYAYFVSAPAWNQNSRLALSRAIVETGSLAIDPYHETTGDKSFRDGHFYSDKAPGVSLLAVPPYAIYYGIRRITGGELPDVTVRPLDPADRVAGKIPLPSAREAGDQLVYNQAHRTALYVCSLFAVAVPSVLAAAAVFLLALRQLGRAQPAALVALAYGLATPAFTYSTALYGHQVAGALLVLGFALVALPPPGMCTRPLALLAGVFAGFAVVAEYPAAVPAVLVAVLAAVRHGFRPAVWLAAGALPCAAVLLGYHAAAFGSPWATGYDFVYRDEFAAGMAVRYGLGLPDPRVLMAITFGPYRGLLYLSPVLVLAVWGLGRELVTSMLSRATVAIAAAVVAYFLILNAGYYMWDGGAAMGPRHLVPLLPFLALGLAPAYRMAPRAWAILACLSALQMLLATAGSPEAAQYGNPLWDFALGRVLERSPGPAVTATNLGLLIGLPGALSLVPLLAVWGLSAPLLRRLEPTTDRESREPSVEDRGEGRGAARPGADDRPPDDAADEQGTADGEDRPAGDP